MNVFGAFDQLFDPAHPSFTPEGVKRLLALQPSEQEHQQMQILAEKANEGLLTGEEQRRYESWGAGRHFAFDAQSQSPALFATVRR